MNFSFAQTKRSNIQSLQQVTALGKERIQLWKMVETPYFSPTSGAQKHLCKSASPRQPNVTLCQFMRCGCKVLRPANKLGKTHSAPLEEFLKVRAVLSTSCVNQPTWGGENPSESWLRLLRATHSTRGPGVSRGGHGPAKFTLRVDPKHQGSRTSS